jgi:hypothetical protein
MKKLVFIIASVFFISTVASANGPTNEGENTASHNIGITIPDLAIIAVYGPSGQGTTISLTPQTENLEAGEAVDFTTATDNSLWLNYTSIASSKGNSGNMSTRRIKAELDENLPNGLDLILEISQASSGSGDIGKATTGKVSLNKGTTWVIDDIGSCYTETGDGKGHQLTYSLDIKDNQYQKLVAESFSVQVTYTISDN